MERPHFDIVASGERMKEIRRQRKISVKQVVEYMGFESTQAVYTQFISRLCDMARDAKRVSSKPTETDNDKYAFRCFLLRLGFIGKEYKTARKILLRNLTGNSAFRYGE